MSDDNSTTDIHVKKDMTVKLPIAYLYTFISGAVAVTIAITAAYTQLRDIKRVQDENHQLLNLKVNHLFQKLKVDNPWTGVTYNGVRREDLPD